VLIGPAIHRRVWQSAPVAVMVAVSATKTGGDGWESNPPRTPQQRPANGFEDPWGRVEFRTGPEGPLTQRSINRLGGSLIVFSEGPHFTARDRLSHQGARGGRFVNRWSVSEIEIGQKGPSSLRPALEMSQHGSQDWTLRLAVGAASTP